MGLLYPLHYLIPGALPLLSGGRRLYEDLI